MILLSKYTKYSDQLQGITKYFDAQMFNIIILQLYYENEVGGVMVTGFSTERTAEYTILHDLYERIKDKYTLFYPFYYQRMRNDTYISFMNQIEELHLSICFARRPKTDFPNSPYSIITLRSSLFRHAKYFSISNIPTLVGAPIGTSVDKIGFGSECKWFQLGNTKKESIYEIEFENGELIPIKYNFIIELDNKNLMTVLNDAPRYSWIEILSIIQEWNYFYRKMYPVTGYFTIPGQKPVIIVYK